MGPARNVGRVFFPLDEELALLPGRLAPRQQSHLVQLASWMPFRSARQVLADLLGVQVSSETARRLCEHVGKQVEDVQTMAAQEPWKADPGQEKNHLRLVLSADGAMVPLRAGEWAEVRTLAIGEVPDCPTEHAPLAPVHVQKLSYFSRLTDAATFTNLAEVETRRRHLVQAKEVCAVMDGAEWLQSFVEIHRADAVRILDFPHAAEHLAKLLQALHTSEQPLPSLLLQRCLHLLKQRGPRALARVAQRLTEKETGREDVGEHLGYLQKRLGLMQYPSFRRAGWPIGSGMVESANKLVVQARLKGAGMRWERKNVNPMLALRNGVCNERWQETWQTASQQRRFLLLEHRHQRTAQRQEALKPPLPPLAPLLPPDPPAMIPGTSRPSEHHPWKRGPACAPKPFAKS